MEKLDCISPGKIWLDTSGNRIQAHGGGVMCADGKFYWYGENKEKTFSCYGTWHWGVRLYSSDDLYNWKDEGLICLPEPDDIKSPLHPKSKMDRPHILYNKKYNNYVMWMKIMGPYDIQYMVTACSDSIKGPFEIVNKKIHPGGMNSGDFDLVQFDDGRACIVFDRVHYDMVVIDLTDDYLDTTVNYSTHYYRRCPPYVREAPAVCFRNNKGYVFTSGTTGYFPNPSEVASFDDIHSKWTVLGDPHVGDEKHTSFDSQISCVFKHPQKKDLYIAMADRWLTDLKDDRPDVREIFAAKFDPEVKSDLKDFDLDSLSKKNTSLADYVWLPIDFSAGIPQIKWYDEWKIEDFE